MVIAVIVVMTVGSRGARLDNLDMPYWMQIATFTVMSNIFLGIISLVAVILKIRSCVTSRPMPRSFNTWYLTAATAGLVTMLTVIFFLAPMRAAKGKNYFDMLLEPMFFLHFFNPLLAAVSYIFLTGTTALSKNSRIIAVTPVVIYAIPYILFVAILKIAPDFYGLTFGGRYYLMPLVFLAFIILAFSAASLLLFLRSRAIINTRRKGGRVV